jgi:acyl-CoA synthetase (NDP forming)
MTFTPDLKKLFDARGVALVGATSDLTKFGSWPLQYIKRFGYQGVVYGVNPKYDKLFDWPCVPQVSDLPPEVEAVLIMLPAVAAVEATEECGRHGIKTVVIMSSGFAEAGDDGRALQDRLYEIAQKYEITICGPNTDGVVNYQTGQVLSHQPIMQRSFIFNKGGITVISHSGAMTSAILSRLLVRGLGVNCVVACGNQLIVTMEDYLHYFADDPFTDVVILFVEAVRNPPAMREAIARCRKNGKRVVVLKIGESEGAQKAALSHTGAVAGSYRNTIAYFEKQGAICVESLETMAVTVEILSKLPNLDPAADVAIVSCSGGNAALMADCCQRLGVKVREIGPAAYEKLEKLSQATKPANPYDLAGLFSKEFVAEVLSIFLEDGFKTLIFGLGVFPDPLRDFIIEAVVEASDGGFANTFIYCPAPEPSDLAMIEGHRIVLAQDLDPVLRTLASVSGSSCEEGDVIDHTVGRFDSPKKRDEHSLKQWVSEIGIKAPRSVVVQEGSAVNLGELTRPVVVKGLSETVAHKTELDLVEVGLWRDDEIQASVERIAGRLASIDPASDQVLIEEMISGGIEVLLGCVRDPQLGPVVVVGAGGILAELLSDNVILVPPFSRQEIVSKLKRTRIWKLLGGYRGRVYDREALIGAVLLMGDLAVGLEEMCSLEINPLFVMQQGVLAGDVKLEIETRAH